jgi:hypothetical protein
MSRVQRIGIIAEDDSDFAVIKELICRITDKRSLTFKKKAGGGCGRVRRKCVAWAEELKTANCTMLILVHDRDRHNYAALHEQLVTIMSGSSFTNRYICIPVEELEAWFLSDPDTLKSSLRLDKPPRVSGIPEEVDSPKEYIEDQVRTCSQGRVTYLNTVHNLRIAEAVSIPKVLSKCPSFQRFHEYVSSHSYR